MSGQQNSIDQLLDLSRVLTGFSRVELQGTGMLETYYGVLNEIVDSDLVGRLLLVYQAAVEASNGELDRLEVEVRRQILDDDDLGPLAANLTTLWYLGQWNQLPREWRSRWGASAKDRDFVVSDEAYRQGLAWVAMGAHPMGTKQQGFGAWHLPPPKAGE